MTGLWQLAYPHEEEAVLPPGRLAGLLAVTIEAAAPMTRQAAAQAAAAHTQSQVIFCIYC